MGGQTGMRSATRQIGRAGLEREPQAILDAPPGHGLVHFGQGGGSGVSSEATAGGRRNEGRGSR